MLRLLVASSLHRAIETLCLKNLKTRSKRSGTLIFRPEFALSYKRSENKKKQKNVLKNYFEDELNISHDLKNNSISKYKCK